jgi:hypothetical protein
MIVASMGDLQRRAIDHVASLSAGGPVDKTLRVTLNFHPDRTVGGEPILRRLAREGVYRSQFETGVSNGGLTAFPGGERWAWESRIFGGAYDSADAGERPKYGALNFRHRPVGAAPRFGSAHLRLTPQTMARTTFCFPDSVFNPTHFGVESRMSLIDLALGCRHDILDDYVEAQIHGYVCLADDVEALVLDPCYRGTEIETLASMLPCPVEWHQGFRLGVDELRRRPTYRGPEYVALGITVAQHGLLDPRVIGDAVRTNRYDEQALKRVWHYVARFGAPGQWVG